MFKRSLIVYFLILFLGFLISGYLISTFIRSHLIKEITTRLDNNLTLLRPLFNEAVINDPQLMSQLVKKRASEIQIRVTIIDKKGRVIADSDSEIETMDNHNSRPEIYTARLNGRGQNIRFSKTLNQNMLYLAEPHTPMAPDGAILRVSISLTKIHATLNLLHRTVALVLLVVGVLVGLSSFLFFRQKMHPLKEIYKVTEAASKGDYSKKAPLVPGDDFSQLAQTINQLMKDLDSRLKDLSQEKDKLETVMTSMQDGVITLDADNKIKHYNRAASIFLDFQPPITDELFWEKMRNEQVSTAIEKVRSLQESRQFILTFNSRTLELGINPLGLGGEILIDIRDITEEIKYDSLRREFVGNISHELRTPLSIISGYVETLQNGALKELDQAQSFLSVMEKNVKQLTNLVDDLLVISKMESHEEIAEMTIFEINPFIQQIIHDLNSLIIKKQHTVNQQLSLDLPMIKADLKLLERALVNLIENAVKYTPPGGNILVRTQKDHGNIIIEVIDTGIGIPEENFSRLFERFYRVDKSRSREMGGTGLGLSIVKHIAQLHQGSVSVRSQVGSGSTFSLKIPVNS